MTTTKVKSVKRASGAEQPVNGELRARARAYARARRREGASQAAIGRELGVSQVTVSRWLRAGDDARAIKLARPVTPTAAFTPVEILDRPAAARPTASLIVTTPRGLRIEGLDIDALCTLVERLG